VESVPRAKTQLVRATLPQGLRVSEKGKTMMRPTITKTCQKALLVFGLCVGLQGTVGTSSQVGVGVGGRVREIAIRWSVSLRQGECTRKHLADRIVERSRRRLISCGASLWTS